MPVAPFAVAMDRSAEPVQPIPDDIQVDARKVALGERLFHDTRLSADNSVSCAGCHALNRGGADGREHSIGVQGNEGFLNTPTVFNSALNFTQFWDGRADTLETQVEMSVHSDQALNTNWPKIIAKLSKDKSYQLDFNAIYQDGMTSGNIKNAMVEFERSLITPDSRFDRYLRGDDNAISEDEKTGYTLFKEYGCVACHQGSNVGGNMFQMFGVMRDYFQGRAVVNSVDYGRYNVTGLEADRYLFKVPSLRMVTLTSPYLHDGSIETLESAIEVMVEYQLGREIRDDDVKQIIKFLYTLVGTYKGESLEPKK